MIVEVPPGKMLEILPLFVETKFTGVVMADCVNDILVGGTITLFTEVKF
jgi:hypothetical protein